MHANIDIQPQWDVQRSLRPRSTGRPNLLRCVGARHPWLVGGMAYGISSVAMVRAAAQGGGIAFFGAAGLPLDAVDRALVQLRSVRGPVGLNLAHHPSVDRDDALVDLALEHGVRLIEASAFLRPTAAILRWRWAGAGPRPRVVFAKASHPSVFQRWMAPPTARLLRGCVERGELTREEAERAASWPCCDALTVEGDSGGHTDRRPLMALLPCALIQAERAQRALGHRVLIGAAGGLGTPGALAGVLAMGADYAMGGSVHASCVESGVSPRVRGWLAAAGPTDMALAPAADRFESGARVQVLRHGTPFARHAARLESIWRTHGSLNDAPARDQAWAVERLESANASWETVSRWMIRHRPDAVERTREDPQLRLAARCRAWLAACARRAIDDDGHEDVQVWCGPAVGAFNTAVAGTPLATPETRTVAAVARHLVDGASHLLHRELMP